MIRIAELEFDEYNESELAAHRIAAVEVLGSFGKSVYGTA
jgi:hypothetical protein